MFTLLSIPRFQGLDVVPERLVFDVSATAPGEEAVAVTSDYTATGLSESLSLSFEGAEVTSVSVLLAAGNLSDASWSCQPRGDDTSGAIQRFSSASDAEIDRADELSRSAQHLGMLFNLPQPEWTGALTMALPAGAINSVYCEREGDLAPTKALSYRFFAAPIVTVAVNTEHDIDLERTTQIYMAGEWEPSDAIWTSTESADTTSIASDGPVQWRDPTLVLHDAIWSDIFDRWNFVASALVGAIAGLAATAIATRVQREVIEVAPAPPLPERVPPGVRRFRRRFGR